MAGNASEPAYDAIVIGSGITGGWAAKELTERGLRVLMIERGRAVIHGRDYPLEDHPPQDLPFRGLGDRRLSKSDYAIQSNIRSVFNEATMSFFANDRLNPYTTPAGRPFNWIRGQQLGGKSLTWGRQSYRFAPLNFEENGIDGHGVDWPIRYDDLAPWYDHVERFIGVSGSKLDHPMAPNGIYQPAYPLNVVELELQRRFAALYPDRPVSMARMANLTQTLGDRQACHYCGTCERGCTVGAYFSTQSSTLPAAEATGRLTVKTDTVVEALLYDEASGRVSGVRAIGREDRRQDTFSAGLFFVCASALESVRLLLNSTSRRFPAGLGNDHGVLGHYIMDHFPADAIVANVAGPQVPNYTGFRPAPLFVPRFRNVGSQREKYVRGYQLYGFALPTGWGRGLDMEGFGAGFKQALSQSGPWQVVLGAMNECLPRWDNKVTIDPEVRDAWGIPTLHVDVTFGENDRMMREEASGTLRAMMTRAGYRDFVQTPRSPTPGNVIHEMGGAPMGRDPRTSMLDGFNRAHAVRNLFVTDGAAMASCASVNPSLTYMALTARAAAHAADAWKKGEI